MAQMIRRTSEPPQSFQRFAILDAASGRPVGCASYMRHAPELGSVEVGAVTFGPNLKRTPAATEAMYLMMRRVFEAGWRRYEWKCDALNAASRAAALRLGFRFEGVFRNERVYHGRNRDTAWFSVIDREWPLLRQAMECWLEPGAFDEAGRQRRRLSDLIEEVRDHDG
jgi:RimJ/RimL family protein N-acetyltransferase